MRRSRDAMWSQSRRPLSIHIGSPVTPHAGGLEDDDIPFAQIIIMWRVAVSSTHGLRAHWIGLDRSDQWPGQKLLPLLLLLTSFWNGHPSINGGWDATTVQIMELEMLALCKSWTGTSGSVSCSCWPVLLVPSINGAWDASTVHIMGRNFCGSAPVACFCWPLLFHAIHRWSSRYYCCANHLQLEGI